MDLGYVIEIIFQMSDGDCHKEWKNRHYDFQASVMIMQKLTLKSWSHLPNKKTNSLVRQLLEELTPNFQGTIALKPLFNFGTIQS